MVPRTLYALMAFDETKVARTISRDEGEGGMEATDGQTTAKKEEEEESG